MKYKELTHTRKLTANNMYFRHFIPQPNSVVAILIAILKALKVNAKVQKPLDS